MNLNSKVFLRKLFKRHYFKTRVAAPPQVARREFGVGTLEDKIKVRHKAFKGERDFTAFLKAEAPFFISCSSALYEFPSNQPMDTKVWQGADLVFDLDAPMKILDADVLEDVRRETQNLADFLTDDFGFNAKDLEVNFSGSKGYHIHVRSPSVLELDSDARREIVDYVTGSGLDFSCFLNEDSVEGVVFDGKGRGGAPKGIITGPTGEVGGWGGRIYDRFHTIMRDSSEQDFKKIKGVGPKMAARLVADREKNLRALERGKWEGLLDVSARVRNQVVSDTAVAFASDTDKMVTLDTSRLMRVPDTIHGGTGLVAANVSDLDSFNPLTDAVAFGDSEVEVQLTASVDKLSLMENNFEGLKQASKVKLPEYAAAYLILSGRAEISS